MKLSASSISKYQLCPRKYKYHYIDESQGDITSVPMTQGTAFHAGLDTLWTGGTIAEAQHSMTEHTSSLAKDRRFVLGLMLHGYAANYQNDKFTDIQSELEVEVEVGDNLLVRGILDKLVLDDQGNRVLVEHKTTRSDLKLGSRYWQRLEADTQIDLYFWICRELGFPVEYMIYDVVRIPFKKRLPATKLEYYKRGEKKGQLKPGCRHKVETDLEFQQRMGEFIIQDRQFLYAREHVFRTERDIDRMASDIRGVQQYIQLGVDTDTWPRNLSSCFAYGNPCEYSNGCIG